MKKEQKYEDELSEALDEEVDELEIQEENEPIMEDEDGGDE